MRLFSGQDRNRQPNAPTNPHQFASQAESLIPAEVRMISGCHSEQTSADVSNVNCVKGRLPHPAGRSGGACTSALLGLLYEKRHEKLTFQQVLLDLRDSLARSGFDQVPQLTSSRPLELQETPFSFVGGQGTRRALLVGINYRGQSGQLSGCHNDVLNMKKYLMEVQGYWEHNILIMIDDGKHHFPTREKMIRGLKMLVAQSVAGDSVYFHYSGHGGLLDPEWNAFKGSNKEYDETLYPVDHNLAGQIRDFSLFNHFVKPMAAGVTVTCVMDCCHSGSVLDLPYTFRPTSGGTIRMQRNLDSLSNLAFLYILAGGMLPPIGFEDVTSNIEAATGGNLDDYQGIGVEEISNDTEVIQDDYGGTVDGFTDGVDANDAVDGADYGAEDHGAGDDYGTRDYGGGDFGMGDDYGADNNGEETYALADGTDLDADSVGYGQPEIVAGENVYNAGGDDYVPGADVYNSDYVSGGDMYNNATDYMTNRDVGDSADYDAGMMGDAGGAFEGLGDAGDIDCGCIQDILGALLDDEE